MPVDHDIGESSAAWVVKQKFGRVGKADRKWHRYCVFGISPSILRIVGPRPALSQSLAPLPHVSAAHRSRSQVKSRRAVVNRTIGRTTEPKALFQRAVFRGVGRQFMERQGETVGRLLAERNQRALPRSRAA